MSCSPGEWSSGAGGMGMSEVLVVELVMNPLVG